MCTRVVLYMMMMLMMMAYGRKEDASNSLQISMFSHSFFFSYSHFIGVSHVYRKPDLPRITMTKVEYTRILLHALQCWTFAMAYGRHIDGTTTTRERFDGTQRGNEVKTGKKKHVK